MKKTKKVKKVVMFPQHGKLVFCRLYEGYETGCDKKFCMVE